VTTKKLSQISDEEAVKRVHPGAYMTPHGYVIVWDPKVAGVAQKELLYAWGWNETRQHPTVQAWERSKAAEDHSVGVHDMVASGADVAGPCIKCGSIADGACENCDSPLCMACDSLEYEDVMTCKDADGCQSRVPSTSNPPESTAVGASDGHTCDWEVTLICKKPEGHDGPHTSPSSGLEWFEKDGKRLYPQLSVAGDGGVGGFEEWWAKNEVACSSFHDDLRIIALLSWNGSESQSSALVRELTAERNAKGQRVEELLAEVRRLTEEEVK